MYKHILIPTDGSSLSDQAIRQGIVYRSSSEMKSDSLPRLSLTLGTATLGGILKGDQELAPSERKPLAKDGLKVVGETVGGQDPRRRGGALMATRPASPGPTRPGTRSAAARA